MSLHFPFHLLSCPSCLVSPLSSSHATHVRVVPAYTGTFWMYTRRRFWIHTRRAGGHRQFCLPKFAHVWLSRASDVHQKKTLGSFNRLRTTRCRVLQSFAFPDKAVQFQLSWGKQAAVLFRWSIALFSKHNERCERQYRHEPPPAFAVLRQGSPSFKSWHSLSYSNHFQDHGIFSYTCTYKNHIHIRIRLHISTLKNYRYMCHHESIVTDTTTFGME